MEGVRVGPNHHHHLLERVRSSSELSPVDPILVSAPVMAPTVPDSIEVGVSTGIIPPSSLLIVGAVSCVDIVVPVQGGELFAVVPGKGVTCIAVIAPQPKLIVLALWLQSEASVFCKDLAARPVLHGYKQFVVALVRQPVDIFQAQPVFAVDVPKSLLIGLPVSEEVDRAIQAPLDDGPTPRVMPLVAPHLHEAVGVLRLHQVDGAGAVAIFQGL